MAVRLAFVGSPASAADRQRAVAGRRRLEQASDCHESDVERGGDASSILCAVSTELIHPSIDPVLSRPVASSCAPSAPYSALLLQLAPLRARPIPQRAPTQQTQTTDQDDRLGDDERCSPPSVDPSPMEATAGILSFPVHRGLRGPPAPAVATLPAPTRGHPTSLSVRA